MSTTYYTNRIDAQTWQTIDTNPQASAADQALARAALRELLGQKRTPPTSLDAIRENSAYLPKIEELHNLPS